MSIKGFKGFDKDLKCSPHGNTHQYEIGKEYEQEGRIEACDKGFHFCERPLDVFRYYAPANSRYCKVEGDGEIDRDGEDSKVAASKIKIGAEIGIPGLVKAHIEYTKAHTTSEHTDPKQATAGTYGAATAGYRGAATAGDSGAATAGNYGAATAGESGAATARGTVSVGKNGIGSVRGNGIKAKGGLGAVLVIVIENEYDYNIKEWKAAVVDGEVIKEDTFYTLKDGEFVEVK